jgi:hypothetical protein
MDDDLFRFYTQLLKVEYQLEQNLPDVMLARWEQSRAHWREQIAKKNISPELELRIKKEVILEQLAMAKNQEGLCLSCANYEFNKLQTQYAESTKSLLAWKRLPDDAVVCSTIPRPLRKKDPTLAICTQYKSIDDTVTSLLTFVMSNDVNEWRTIAKKYNVIEPQSKLKTDASR